MKRIFGALLVSLPGLAQAQDANPQAITELAGLIRWGGVLTSLFVIVGVWFGLRIIRGFTERLSKQFPARRLSLQKIGTVVQFVAYVVTGTIVIMLSVQIDDTVLALIGGTIAVSVGFAVRDVVASFIAGIIIIIDRPFQVGDRVLFGGEYGDITAVGLRSVRMQTLDDNTVTIPNNKFITDMTSCGNYGALDMQVVMDFYLGVDEDFDEGRRIAMEAALTSRYVYLPKPIVILVNPVVQANSFAIRLRLKAYVLDTRYEKAFETDVNLRVLRAFRKANIRTPAMAHQTSTPRAS